MYHIKITGCKSKSNTETINFLKKIALFKTSKHNFTSTSPYEVEKIIRAQVIMESQVLLRHIFQIQSDLYNIISLVKYNLV